MRMKKIIFYVAILAFTFAAPFLFPDFRTHLATLWLMITFFTQLGLRKAFRQQYDRLP